MFCYLSQQVFDVAVANIPVANKRRVFLQIGLEKQVEDFVLRSHTVYQQIKPAIQHVLQFLEILLHLQFYIVVLLLLMLHKGVIFILSIPMLCHLVLVVAHLLIFLVRIIIFLPQLFFRFLNRSRFFEFFFFLLETQKKLVAVLLLLFCDLGPSFLRIEIIWELQFVILSHFDLLFILIGQSLLRVDVIVFLLN